jgi:CheY-like chemotaxis protein
MNGPDGNESQEKMDGASRLRESHRELSRHLHDLKNLLWPLSILSQSAPIESASSELVDLVNRFAAGAQEALDIATRMSELMERQSANFPGQTSECDLARRCIPPAAASRMRILCVVNDSHLRSTLAHLLVYLGHDADSSCTGAAALESFASHPYDVVVTDIHLVDMNGRILTGNLRAHGPLPVIWLSGAVDVSQEIVAQGPDSPTCILAKPLTLGALRKALESISALVATTAT